MYHGVGHLVGYPTDIRHDDLQPLPRSDIWWWELKLKHVQFLSEQSCPLMFMGFLMFMGSSWDEIVES